MSLLSNPLALRVKLADMVHNLSSSPTPKQKLKYMNALNMMSDAAGGLPSGISPKHWDSLTALSEPEVVQELRAYIREIIS